MRLCATLLLMVAGSSACARHADPAVVTATLPTADRAELVRVNRGTARTSSPPESRPAPARLNPATALATTTTVVGAGQGAGLFEATCYSPPTFPAGQRTSSGAPVGPGSIAADPRIFPMGTRLWVENYGAGVVVDTGGAIHGRRLDLWMSSLGACLQFGRRMVRVRRLG